MWDRFVHWYDWGWNSDPEIARFVKVLCFVFALVSIVFVSSLIVSGGNTLHDAGKKQVRPTHREQILREQFGPPGPTGNSELPYLIGKADKIDGEVWSCATGTDRSKRTYVLTKPVNKDVIAHLVGIGCARAY